MTSSHWLKLLHSLGWEFWLPLPLLGFIFWFSGNLMAEQVLSRSYGTFNKLQADVQSEVKLAVTVLIINAEVNQADGLTKVAVTTTDSTLKKLEFEFPSVEIKEIEKAIAQELRMPTASVRKLTRYQLKY